MRVIPTKIIFLWFGLAFLVKFLTAIYVRYLIGCTPVGYHLDELVIAGGDYFSYNNAMENYLQTGNYYFDNGVEKVYAGRLPHYSLIYLLLRQVFNIAYTNFIIMVLQIAAECLAFLLLAKLARQITGRISSFYLVYFLYLISFLTSYYNNQVLPDSLSVSVLIFFLYFFHQYLFAPVFRNLLLTGFFLGLLVMLKPYFSLLYLGVGICFLCQTKQVLRKRGLRLLLQKTAIVSLPLFFFVTPWVIRNYQVYRQFIPFQINTVAGYHYTPADMACRRFLQAIGEDFIEWEKTSAGNYFNKNCLAPCTYTLPTYAYTRSYDSTRVEQVRSQYLQLQHHYTADQDQAVAKAFNKLTKSFRSEKPVYFYVISPLMLSKKFLFTTAGYFPKSNCPGLHVRLTYLVQAVLYWSTLLLGTVGLLILARRNWRYLLFIAILIFLILFFPVFFRGVELRYFMHSYPVLLLGFVFFIEQIRSKFQLYTH